MERQYPEWVTEYIGIPFNEKGWNKKEGFHCWSLVREILQVRFNIVIPSYQEAFDGAYDAENIEKAIYEEAEKQWKQVDDPTFGDVGVFRIAGYRSHIGLILDKEFMLHVMEGMETCLARYNTLYWKPRLYGYFRHESKL